MSTWGRGEPVVLIPVVGDVERLLDHLHITSAHIAGDSMGGAIKHDFLAAHRRQTSQ